jgi:hypothetical protein
MSENTITLYFIKSPYSIDWHSPKTLARSIIKNYFSFQKNFMGHVNIELKGKLPSGDDVDILTGMVAGNLNAKKMLFVKKIGLGVVFHSFKGHLESRADVGEMVNKYLERNNRINYLTFKISSETLQKLVEYHTQYNQENLQKFYGLYNRPRYKEGGGCSAFGASFLDIAGLLFEEFKKEWTYQLKMPMKLIGMPIQENKVSFFKLLFTNHKWATSEEDYKEIFFWDPDKMYQWVEKTNSR